MFVFGDHGVDVTEAQTMYQVMVKAGLDWETTMQPVALGHEMAGQANKLAQNLDEVWVVSRKKDHKALGVVDRGYKLFQNADVLSCLDGLLLNGDLIPQRAGTFHDDKTLWVVLEIPEAFTLVSPRWHQGYEHKIARYVLVTANHERSNTLELHLMPWRNDGVGMAFAASNKAMRFHPNELQRGLVAFAESKARFADIAETFQWLCERRFVHSQFQNWVRLVFPELSEQSTQILEELFRCEVFSNTAFGAMGAMSKYIDTIKMSKEPYARWAGGSRILRGYAMKALAEAV